MIKQSFKIWSKQFIHDNSPFGDVARDIESDSDFPNYVSRYRLRRYLEDQGACDACLNVFDEMFEEYKEN